MNVRNMSVAEAQNTDDFEKLKELFKKVDTQYFVPIVVASINMFKNVGEFTEAIGNLQKNNEEAYDIVFKLSEQNPETLLLSFVNKIPEEKLRPIVELTLKMATIQNQLKDLKKVSADKKIKLGKEIQEIANSLIQLLGELPK